MQRWNSLTWCYIHPMVYVQETIRCQHPNYNKIVYLELNFLFQQLSVKLNLIKKTRNFTESKFWKQNQGRIHSKSKKSCEISNFGPDPYPNPQSCETSKKDFLHSIKNIMCKKRKFLPWKPKILRKTSIFSWKLSKFSKYIGHGSTPTPITLHYLGCEMVLIIQGGGYHYDPHSASARMKLL